MAALETCYPRPPHFSMLLHDMTFIQKYETTDAKQLQQLRELLGSIKDG